MVVNRREFLEQTISGLTLVGLASVGVVPTDPETLNQSEYVKVLLNPNWNPRDPNSPWGTVTKLLTKEQFYADKKKFFNEPKESTVNVFEPDICSECGQVIYES